MCTHNTQKGSTLKQVQVATTSRVEFQFKISLWNFYFGFEHKLAITKKILLNMLAQPFHLVDLLDVYARFRVWVKQHMNHFLTVCRQFASDFLAKMITPGYLVPNQPGCVLIVEWHDSVEHNIKNDSE